MLAGVDNHSRLHSFPRPSGDISKQLDSMLASYSVVREPYRWLFGYRGGSAECSAPTPDRRKVQ